MSSAAVSVEPGNDEIITPIDEIIASFIWHNGDFVVSYYNLATLDLYISHITFDMRPHFCQMLNFLRIMPNIRNLLASGPDHFLQAVMRARGITEKTDPKVYKLNNLESVTAATFIVYTNNEKTAVINRRRIYQLQLPRMSKDMNDTDRHNFMNAVIPMHHTLIVQCLGNLLSFLDVNWNHLFLHQEARVVVSDLRIYKLEDNVLIDESTFRALKIFSENDHPSGFKSGTKSSLVSKSLFTLMNTCASDLGKTQLKAWLYQPISNITELHRRHKMIVWCQNEKNAGQLIKMRTALKQISNVGALYGRLIRTRGSPSVWKLFKRSLYYTNELADICIALVKSKTPDIVDTVIEKYGKYAIDNKEVSEMLNKVDTIIDLDESMRIGEFCVRYEIDPELDADKEQFLEAKDEVRVLIVDDIRHLPPTIKEFTVHLVAELGFLIGFSASGLESPQVLESSRFKFIHHMRNTYYYTSPRCKDMSDKYGGLYVKIRNREMEICKRLMEDIYTELFDIHHATSHCAQIDCLMAMASFAQKHKLVPPTFVTDRKILDIKDGRNVLVELYQKCIPNDTLITVEKKNLINILISPNASGKSVYMKTIAQIVYLAHIGSYVPAKEVKMSVFDAIYSRMYFPETVSRGASSFLIELNQMSNATMNSSTNSLILIDEFGHGTTENDGKSLLLASLHHFAKRSDKSPITFVTTHYTDVYDFMKDVEWCVLRTFQMFPSARDGEQLSTYKIIDGRYSGRYTKDCPVVRTFLNQPKNDGPSTSTADVSECFLNSSGTLNAIEEVEEVEDIVRHKKIECAAAVIQAFVRKKLGKKVDFMDIINKYNI